MITDALPDAAAQAPEIALDRATLVRDGVQILGPLSFRLAVRRLAIVGRNGSGKSSLLRLLSGLAPASAGAVRIAGIDPAQDRSVAIRTVGILFQNPDHQIIFPTVAEELAFGLEQIGRTRRAALNEVTEMLARYGRTDWAPRQVHSLSEGQRRWLCLMAVLAMQPRILLLDEPFAGLDIPTITALEAELARLPQTLVTITHDPAQVADYDHILWLENGTIADQGPAAIVLPAYLAEMRRLGAQGLC